MTFSEADIVKVTLSLDEYNEASGLARRRSQKINSRKFSDHSEFKIHLMGTLAEFAFSKKTGIEAQTDVSSGGDSGYDFTVGEKTIQIKTRDCQRFPYPDLLVRLNYAKADYYILSTWSSDSPQIVAFIGYTDYDNLIKEKIDLGRGDRFICTRENLGDMNLMFNKIAEHNNKLNGVHK